MSLNVTRTALDVIGVGRIYYNQQEKDEGPWSKTIGLFCVRKMKEMPILLVRFAERIL